LSVQKVEKLHASIKDVMANRQEITI